MARSKPPGVVTMNRKRTHGLTVAILAAITAVTPAAGPVAAASGTGARAHQLASLTAVTGARLTAGTVWQPPADTDWMWELSQPLKTNNARLMGTGVTVT
jgi:hypothetical protein